jgi:hypothetical protein
LQDKAPPEAIPAAFFWTVTDFSAPSINGSTQM